MAPVKSRRATVRAAASRSSSDPRGKYAPPTTTDMDTTTPNDSEHDSSSTTRKKSTGETPSADGTFSLLADTFRTSKKDKRTIKHNTLLNRVHAAGISKEKKQKRRRPAKKLNTDVGDLADALPDVDESGDEAWDGISEEGDGMEVEGAGKQKRRRRRRTVQGEGKMVMESLKYRPGAMRKKSAMEERERERFRRNLAQMMAGRKPAGKKEEAEGDGPAADRWAALRRFIGSTMEKDKAFAGA